MLYGVKQFNLDPRELSVLQESVGTELPRDRQGRYQDGMQYGAPVGVNTVLKYRDEI